MRLCSRSGLEGAWILRHRGGLFFTKVIPIKAAIAYPPVELFGMRHLEYWQVWILYVQVEYIRASLRYI